MGSGVGWLGVVYSTTTDWPRRGSRTVGACSHWISFLPLSDDWHFSAAHTTIFPQSIPFSQSLRASSAV